VYGCFVFLDGSLRCVSLTGAICPQNRTYVSQNKLKPVYGVGLELFLSQVLRSGGDAVSRRTQAVMLAQIQAERSGEALGVPLLRSAVRMLVDLGQGTTKVYEKAFEGAFLNQTEAFYREESARNYGSLPVGAYLQYADQRMTQEQQRLEDFLFHTTRPKLLRLTAKCLLLDHGVELVEVS
jgi:hypothetical protein